MHPDTLYKQQKGGTKKYTTKIKIAEVQDKDKFYLVKDIQGNFYSRWKKESDNWDHHLQPGNYLGVYVREVKKGDRTYKNIYPDLSNLEPIPEE